MNFKSDEGITTPTKAHHSDAGYDIYSPIDFTVEAHSFSQRINLGVAFEIPYGYCGYVVERSSQGKNGVNAIGPIVDYGYTGNVHVTLVNNSDSNITYSKGDRICQIVVLAIGMEELVRVDEFKQTERGEGAHGSSGK